jgi:hypothetical protein
MSPVQDTKGSQHKKGSALGEKRKIRTAPLPLEVVFRPAERGEYSIREGEYLGEREELYRPDFEPGRGSDEPIEDPWLMREEFLQRDEEDDWTPFNGGITLVYGRFGSGDDDLTIPSEKLGKDPVSVWRVKRLIDDEVLEWQSLIRAAMVTPMERWPTLKKTFPPRKVDLLCRPMALAVEWENGYPRGAIKCTGVLQALVATLQVDALIGAKYRFCACGGCPHSFEVRRKDQRYCSEGCKHKQVVRDGREWERRIAAAKQKTSGKLRGK